MTPVDKTEEMKTNPLMSVEELEEGNYNMIDGIPNNGFGEKNQKKFRITSDDLKITKAKIDERDAAAPAPQREKQQKEICKEL